MFVINWGLLLSLLMIFLGLVFLAASWFSLKREDGHYRLEEPTHLETGTLRKVYRRFGWGCLVVGLFLGLWFSVIFD